MRFLSLALIVCSSAFAEQVSGPALVLRKGDHIAFVGAGAMEAEQHTAWLETLIHVAYADKECVFRNLAYTGDEVAARPRSEGVPSLSYFLDMKPGTVTLPHGNGKIVYHAGADFHASVIIAQWGFNESFAGQAGLKQFKQDLGRWVAERSAADYGQGKPRIVLVTPLAQQVSAGGPDLNVNLALYAQAVREVAAEKSIPCVDLFSHSLRVFKAQGPADLTINGIRLNEAGDRKIAPGYFQLLFGKAAPGVDNALVARVRSAILEKNRQWFLRFRTVDQFNIYGERSRILYGSAKDPKVKFSNAITMGQELSQRDVLTANGDRMIWAAAQGKKDTPTLLPLPPVGLVDANMPAKDYLTGEATIPYLKLPEGCKIELVADETTIPELINPVQMGFDPKGRLWVAVWPTYPGPRPTEKRNDKLLVLDLDSKTGKVARTTIFRDGLSCPTGFQFYKGGVLLMQAPNLWWVRDTDGDGHGETVERLVQGMDSADSHHSANSLCREPGGAIYLSDGVFHRTSVESPWGLIRNQDGCIYRYEPNTGKFGRHAAYGFANPHGRVFDYWGNDLITDGTGNQNYFGPAFSGHLDKGKHREMRQFWDRPSRPSAANGLISSRHFPDDWQGQFLSCNVIGYQGIFRVKMSEVGSGVQGQTLPDGLVQGDVSKVPHFRPVAVSVAPDGSIYVLDWCQHLIGHLQHHLRDPNRDHGHGRIYRITYPSRPLLVPKAIAGQSIPALLELLKEPEDDVRLRAKLELETRPAREVIAAAQKWERGLDVKDPSYEHHRLEALWVHQWFDTVNIDLLDAVLKSPEPRARAQAVRVLGYWRDRVPNVLDRLEVAVKDLHPRVRLEVVRVCSFFGEVDALRALQISQYVVQDKDDYIQYCLRETAVQLSTFDAAKSLAKEVLAYARESAETKPPYWLSNDNRELWELGRQIYSRDASCMTCHQKDGNGLPPAFPPLSGSEWLQGSDERLIKIVLNGLAGPIEVKQKAYSPETGTPPMPALRELLSDREIAAVLVYVRNAFGNRLPIVPEATVAKVRAQTKDRSTFWTAEELLKAHPMPVRKSGK